MDTTTAHIRTLYPTFVSPTQLEMFCPVCNAVLVYSKYFEAKK